METGNGTYIRDVLEQWAAGHETSAEIALAIDTLCHSKSAKMEVVWQTPGPRQMAKILKLAWQNAGEKTKLFWGLETFTRD